MGGSKLSILDVIATENHPELQQLGLYLAVLYTPTSLRVMREQEDVFANWHGIIDDDFCKTISQTFGLSPEDGYIYKTESFATTLSEVQQTIESGNYRYKYSAHGKQIEVSPTDITAYTSIFSPATDTTKALTAFSANAKKGSPREIVAQYLGSQRINPIVKIPKSKLHVNPYLDLWTNTCKLTTFLGPLPDHLYAHPENSKRTHPILPILYHHFGCVVPSYEALHIIQSVAMLSKAPGIIDMGSGNGYWTYMLRRMKLEVVGVDNMESEYRTMWIPDTVKADGVKYLQRNSGGKDKILLMVYMITAGTFTRRVLQEYKGNAIVIVGTQNANRYTGFSDCTVEEYFEKEMSEWVLTSRIAMPSFAGKDEAMFLWQRTP